MRLTTTPGGATLAYLEAGDVLERNDLAEDDEEAFTMYGTDADSDWYMPGHTLDAEEVALFKPRRYIPAE